jgi:hypothetical protein
MTLTKIPRATFAQLKTASTKRLLAELRKYVLDPETRGRPRIGRDVMTPQERKKRFRERRLRQAEAAKK